MNWIELNWKCLRWTSPAVLAKKNESFDSTTFSFTCEMCQSYWEEAFHCNDANDSSEAKIKDGRPLVSTSCCGQQFSPFTSSFISPFKLWAHVVPSTCCFCTQCDGIFKLVLPESAFSKCIVTSSLIYITLCAICGIRWRVEETVGAKHKRLFLRRAAPLFFSVDRKCCTSCKALVLHRVTKT